MCSIVNVSLNSCLFFHFHLYHLNNVCGFFAKMIENMIKHVFGFYNLKILKKKFRLYNLNESIMRIEWGA